MGIFSSRFSILGAVFLAVLAGFSPPALAGLNPLIPGLPGQLNSAPWTSNTGRGYPSFANVTGNPGSTMCVECHYANPSRTLDLPTPPNGEPEGNYRGSHYVINNFAGGNPVKVVDTSLEKNTAWGSGGPFSKYATFPDGSLPTNNAVGVRGEMICESCHNLLMNTGDGLLLGDYDTTTGVSTFCGGCHTGPAGGPPDHHAMTGNNVGKESTCPGPSQPTCSNEPHVLNIDHTIHLVDKDVVEANKPDTLGVGYFIGKAVPMSCQSCHKPHRALTWTGARVLRRGEIILDTQNKPINVVYGSFESPTYSRGDVVQRSTAAHGLHRQVDMASGKRLVVNADPLCISCHK